MTKHLIWLLKSKIIFKGFKENLHTYLLRLHLMQEYLKKIPEQPKIFPGTS